MDASEFVRTAIDAEQWLIKSAELRRAADRLWDCFFEHVLSAGLHVKEDRKEEADKEWTIAASYLTSGKLLYGLSLETALKARLLEERPGDIEFKLTADGKGEVQSAELKQFGVAIGSSHNLEQLAQRSGFLTVEGNKVFHIESDIAALREILRHLSEVVYWSGRYPVPTKSGDGHRPSPDVPARVFGHYIRDWIDPLLDHLQRHHAPPSNFSKPIESTLAPANDQAITVPSVL